MHERLMRIGCLQRLQRIALPGGFAVAGGENPARHRDEMGREKHCSSQGHFHFSRMTVVEQAIGREASVDRAETGRLLRLAPRTADARGRVDDQAPRIDQSAVHQRLQCEDRGRGVAAGGGDRFRTTDRPAVQLRNAVDEFAQQGRGLVRMPIPALIGRGIVQPEVRAQVDERDTAIHDGRRNHLGVPVRQSSEDQVHVGERGFVELLE